MKKLRKDIICPFCDEGTLENIRCTHCKNRFLLCDECEAIYRNEAALNESLISSRCPHCGKRIE